jgi:anti-sigma B factor antagonist
MEFYYHEVHRDVLILHADGEIDSYKVQSFLNQLQRMLEGGARKLVVDCTQIGYVSSVGITAFIRVYKRMAEHGGRVKLASVQTPLMRLLEITKLNQVFESYPTVDDALRAFQ